MALKVDGRTLEKEIAKILEEYGQEVFVASEAGLDAAAEVLKRRLVLASPVKSGKFKKAWKIGTYKTMRVLGNNTYAKDSKISLLNILEYSQTRGKPFAVKTYDAAVSEMADVYAAEVIKKLG